MSGAPSDGFSGCRVPALESRRGEEMRRLIAARGGRALLVPAVEERFRGISEEALTFAASLTRGELDIVIFLTGTGTRMLATAIDGVLPRAAFAEALNRTIVVARGPKPIVALRELGVTTAHQVPRPHTWREILQLLDDSHMPVRQRRVAVQEYGEPPDALLDGLNARGAIVTRVPVYEWVLPNDVQPLGAAVAAAARGEVDVILFTAAVQVNHLFRLAADVDLVDALHHASAAICVCSIGPATTAALVNHGVSPDLESSRSTMGMLVVEASAIAAPVLARKRAVAIP